MSGLSDRVLSNQDLRALQARSNLRGATRLAIHLALLIAAGSLVALSSAWTVLPAVFLLGLTQVTLFAPAHETMHQTAFASRRANAIVGWLTACPSLLNWHFYTAYHLAHHRHAQIPGLDPELTAPPPGTLSGYTSRILGIPYWTLRLLVIRDGWRAYLLAEHTGCTEDRNGLTNTRTTLTSAPVRLLMWDMPYHAEHHLFPSIPFHRLADAHALIRTRLGFLQPGYTRWNIGFVRSLLARPRTVKP
jgi:fatty acid desaturase